jgi:hypothetical protein
MEGSDNINFIKDSDRINSNKKNIEMVEFFTEKKEYINSNNEEILSLRENKLSSFKKKEKKLYISKPRSDKK